MRNLISKPVLFGDRPAGSPPELAEWLRGQLRVPSRVLDIGMPEPELKAPRVMACIGQEMTAGVPQHVRIDRGQSGSLARRRDHGRHVVAPRRSAAL